MPWNHTWQEEGSGKEEEEEEEGEEKEEEVIKMGYGYAQGMELSGVGWGSSGDTSAGVGEL